MKSGPLADAGRWLTVDNGTMQADEARGMVRDTFVTEDNHYGCAETSYIVLKHAFDLPHPEDSSPAMALNGGVAYQGGVCGAITGAALAVGELAGRRIADHAGAKRVARQLTQSVIDGFVEEYGTVNCRDLIGFDLRLEHERFIDSGIWRTKCAEQIDYAVVCLAKLSSQDAWDAAVGR